MESVQVYICTHTHRVREQGRFIFHLCVCQVQTQLYRPPEMPCLGRLRMSVSAISEDGLIYVRTQNAGAFKNTKVFSEINATWNMTAVFILTSSVTVMWFTYNTKFNSVFMGEMFFVRLCRRPFTIYFWQYNNKCSNRKIVYGGMCMFCVSQNVRWNSLGRGLNRAWGHCPAWSLIPGSLFRAVLSLVLICCGIGDSSWRCWDNMSRSGRHTQIHTCDFQGVWWLILN